MKSCFVTITMFYWSEAHHRSYTHWDVINFVRGQYQEKGTLGPTFLDGHKTNVLIIHYLDLEPDILECEVKGALRKHHHEQR